MTPSGTSPWHGALSVGGRRYSCIDLVKVADSIGFDLDIMPFSIRVLLENLLRHEDGQRITRQGIEHFIAYYRGGKKNGETGKKNAGDMVFHPTRVLMQDFTGVPAIVDLAAMRQAVVDVGGDPKVVNPLCPVDLVVDHSLSVDVFARKDAFKRNVRYEFERNHERYAFLRWGQKAFSNLRVVPPGMGICHQVNLEYLARVVWDDDSSWLYPDTVLGTDSHTTMINGLGVLGWGVGGIEAEAALLGQGYSMPMPDVIGVRLSGKLSSVATATDLVLSVTQMLRRYGVVGKFVEFTGPGCASLSVADRATVANMAPEYGATCGFFPIDDQTCAYLRATGRDEAHIERVEAYARKQKLWYSPEGPQPSFTEVLTLDMASVEPSVAGPKRPQDRIALSDAARRYCEIEPSLRSSSAQVSSETKPRHAPSEKTPRHAAVDKKDWQLSDGDVVIAAITSCTNTSNPSTMLAAGLLARRAVELGLRPAPWVKTSLAPGSRAVSAYLERAGLMEPLVQLGFDVVGYGCTTCIGNSGPLPDDIHAAIESEDLTVVSVLSGNRNFEGRIHPMTRANYLASPPLVIAYALAGTMKKDLSRDPIGQDPNGKSVYLSDLWPAAESIRDLVQSCLSAKLFRERYADVFTGTPEWKAIPRPQGHMYPWQDDSTYVRCPPFFQSNGASGGGNIIGLRPLAILGDSVTTDHISPAGAIALDSPAAQYLQALGVEPLHFNSYGSRRGNHEVMMRGTLANIRIRNQMTPDIEGGVTMLYPDKKTLPIYDAAMIHQQRNTPLIIIAGEEYGAGSSRDWAAKGVKLLGVQAVLARSFERIHRSNLIGMGVLPLQIQGQIQGQKQGQKQGIDHDWTGEEIFDILGMEQGVQPRMTLTLRVHRVDGKTDMCKVLCRIDTEDEKRYYDSGGILHHMVRHMTQLSS